MSFTSSFLHLISEGKRILLFTLSPSTKNSSTTVRGTSAPQEYTPRTYTPSCCPSKGKLLIPAVDNYGVCFRARPGRRCVSGTSLVSYRCGCSSVGLRSAKHFRQNQTYLSARNKRTSQECFGEKKTFPRVITVRAVSTRRIRRGCSSLQTRYYLILLRENTRLSRFNGRSEKRFFSKKKKNSSVELINAHYILAL